MADQNQDLQYQIAALALGEYGVDLRKPARPPALVRLDNARFIDERTAVRRDGYLGQSIVDAEAFPALGAALGSGGWLYGHGLVAVGPTPSLVPAITGVSPTGSVAISTTLTWNVAVTVAGIPQSGLSARLTVTYPSGGRPASAPTITTTPAGWTAGAWSNSIANEWTCVVTATSMVLGSSVFTLSSSTGTAAGTLVLGVDTVYSAETTADAIADASASSDVTVTAWTVDATSGIAIPQTATEWTSFLAAKGLSNWSAPDDLWPCQDAGSGLADAVGSIPLSALGTVAYQQPATGWTAKQATSGSTSGFRSTSASLPDVSTTSQLILAIAVPPASVSATTDWLALGGHTGTCALITSTGKIEVFSAATTAATGTNTATGRSSLPVVLQHDHTHSVDGCFTDVDKILPTYTAPASQKGLYCGYLYYGTAVTEGLIYLVQWTGTKAERTSADIKALLTAMGYAPTWT